MDENFRHIVDGCINCLAPRYNDHSMQIRTVHDQLKNKRRMKNNYSTNGNVLTSVASDS